MTPAQVRAALDALPTDADFEAFCIDHFPRTWRRFAVNMDRTQRITLLLSTHGPDALAAALREAGALGSTAAQPVFCVPQPLHPHFTGRTETLEALRHALSEKSVVALWGLGGMGKTQAAVAYACQHAVEHPATAILWTTGDNASHFEQGLLELGRPLSRAGRLREPCDDRDPVAVRRAVLDYLEQAEDYLLICDNVDQPVSLKRVWPHRFGGRVLLTSRSQDVRRLGAFVIELRKLPESDARAYLRSCHPDLGAGEARALSELARELDGLPLALAQAAAFLVEHQSRYSDYLRQYRKQRLGLLEQGLPEDYTGSVATTWAISIEEVARTDRDALDTLKLCAMLHPDAIPEELLARSLPVEDDALALDRRLKPLLTHALLQRDRENRVLSMHRLVQAALRQRMEASEQRRLAHAAATLLDAMFPYVQYENWPLCRRLLPQIPQLFEHVEQLGLFETVAARPLEQAGYFLGEQGQFAEAEPLFRRALLIREKTLGADHPGFATSLNSLSRFLRDQGKLDEAEPLGRHALSIWERALGAEDPMVAFALTNVGKLLLARQKLDEAEPLLRRALRIREQAYAADHLSVSYSLHNLGHLLHKRGKFQEAETCLRRTVAIRERALGAENPELAVALFSLGMLLLDQENAEEAEPLLRRALQIQEHALPAGHTRIEQTRHALKLCVKVGPRASGGG